MEYVIYTFTYTNKRLLINKISIQGTLIENEYNIIVLSGKKL